MKKDEEILNKIRLEFNEFLSFWPDALVRFLSFEKAKEFLNKEVVGGVAFKENDISIAKQFQPSPFGSRHSNKPRPKGLSNTGRNLPSASTLESRRKPSSCRYT